VSRLTGNAPFRRAQIAVLLLVMLAVAACTGSPVPPDRARNVSNTDSVAVVRSDIVAVVTLDGEVEASPTIVIAAPASGVVSVDRQLRIGTSVTVARPLFRLGSLPVRARVNGTFQGWLVANGATVSANIPVAKVRYSGFGIVASTPPDLAYRIFSHHVSATAQIRGGPASFDCIINQPETLPALPDPNANLGNSGSPGSGPAVVCAIPMTIFAVPGLRAYLAIRSASAVGVPALPTAAVAGASQVGAVWLIGPGGRSSLRRIGLGISNGAMIQVTSGLKVGDRVRAVAPDEGS